MDFGTFFTRFYQNNVGGCGATFEENNALGDLGFGKRDLELLCKELGLASVSSDTTVAQLRKQMGSRKVGTVEAAKREILPTREPDMNISGCGARTETSFVAFLRRWFLDTHPQMTEAEVNRQIHRDTLLSFFNRRELLAAIGNRWKSVTSLGPEKEGMTVAGLIGYLGANCKEFREWDYQQGPRGG